MLLSVYAGILIIIFASLTTAMLNGHHKVRHKHHLLNVVHDNHVNEIRSAFDQYRKALHKSRKYNLREIPTANVATLSDEYTDEIENSLNSINHFAATLDRTSSVNQQIISENSPDKYFLRSKRLHVPTRSTISTKKSTTSTLKSIDNYDDEYDDDDNDTTNRRLNDAQVGLMPLKGDVSFLELIKVILSESTILWSLRVIMLLMLLMCLFLRSAPSRGKKFLCRT